MEEGQGAEMAAGPGAVMGLASDRLGLPTSFPGWGWKVRGRLLAPGVQESLACGPEPLFPEISPPPQGWEAGWDPNSDMGLWGDLACILGVQ